MGRTTKTLLLLALLLFGGVVARALRYDHGGGEEEEGEDYRREGDYGRETKEGEMEAFLLREEKQVVQTDAGQMRVVRGFGGLVINDRPMHIGFITMEPKSLFIPQYVDSNLILFVRRGEAMLGYIYNDEVAERRLKIGDVYRIAAGSVFYLVNIGEGQRLHVICSIDPSESLGFGPVQSFYIGGGIYPPSILSGFDRATLATSFNVSASDLGELLSSQHNGPIVFYGDSHSPSIWAKFLKLQEQERMAQMKTPVDFKDETLQEEVPGNVGSWKGFLNSFFGKKNKKEERKKWRGGGKSPDSYNIYDRTPDFRNGYGWSIALDGSDYPPLEDSGIGIYLVNLTAGSTMAPHVNPTATEYGIVLRGAGTIQIVFPNGSLAMNTKVREGDVFWVPRYFPFCQIASRTGPFEFFGFTTSARKNWPQFLVGRNSLLHTLLGPELAASFGTSEERLTRVIDAQGEAVIFPTASVAPADERVEREEEGEEDVEGDKRKPEIVSRDVMRNFSTESMGAA